tara:strand:+ start:886 stop:1086 length:201 start_codon:yes stop_codon:yes gene_type:complete
MIPSEKLKKSLLVLKTNDDFKLLIEFLIKCRKEKLEELEDANKALQIHKLQGYSQALRDLISISSK